MGDRGQVQIVFEKSSVYLYTHWGADDLIETVRTALKRQQRWDDDEYLARIIFSEMIRKDINGETGYGIGIAKHTDIWRLISIDCEKQTVTVKDEGEEDKTMGFEEFIKETQNV